MTNSKLEELLASLGDDTFAGFARSCNLPVAQLRDLVREVLSLREAGNNDQVITEGALREVARARDWYVREGTSVPTIDGGWRHPFSLTIESGDLVAWLTDRGVPIATSDEVAAGRKLLDDALAAGDEYERGRTADLSIRGERFYSGAQFRAAYRHGFDAGRSLPIPPSIAKEMGGAGDGK